MTARVFVDSNVFIYARASNEPLKQPLAAQWIEKLWVEQNGRTSIQVCNEVYYRLTRKVDPILAAEDAWSYVDTLLSWNPCAIDADVTRKAYEIARRYRLNWWDCLIVAAAQVQGCAILLSEDMQDRAIYGSVTVRNPFTLGVSEATAEYVVSPPIPSRHRPRGRPKRSTAA